MKYESCREYLSRKLKEGWKCIKLNYPFAILQSPDGFLQKELDLRNDVETLRPNAAGDETNIPAQYPDSDAHWDKVDEETPDDATTHVRSYTNGAGYHRDLYALPSPTGSGTINKITLFFRVGCNLDDLTVKGAIKSDSTVSETAEKNPYSDFGGNTWGTYSVDWATNPADSQAWEWSDIESLQIGIALLTSGAYDTKCTQVYVEVDYSPAPAPAPAPAYAFKRRFFGRHIRAYT